MHPEASTRSASTILVMWAETGPETYIPLTATSILAQVASAFGCYVRRRSDEPPPIGVGARPNPPTPTLPSMGAHAELI